jgi:ABC-type uncharacterized transport system ATPase subunit
LVDLVHNLALLAEDHKEVLENLSRKARTVDTKKLERSLSEYGTAKSKRIFAALLSAKPL